MCVCVFRGREGEWLWRMVPKLNFYTQKSSQISRRIRLIDSSLCRIYDLLPVLRASTFIIPYAEPSTVIDESFLLTDEWNLLKLYLSKVSVILWVSHIILLCRMITMRAWCRISVTRLQVLLMPVNRQLNRRSPSVPRAPLPYHFLCPPDSQQDCLAYHLPSPFHS